MASDSDRFEPYSEGPVAVGTVPVALESGPNGEAEIYVQSGAIRFPLDRKTTPTGTVGQLAQQGYSRRLTYIEADAFRMVRDGDETVDATVYRRYYVRR